MKAFVRAMFDPLYHDNLLTRNIATIQRHPGLILTRGGTTEMTEAMARGGLLRKGPFKIMGKALEPFMRGFEASLDSAGIYMAQAYEHLATSPARIAQIDAFINEFRGLMNTTRLGISSTQRQLERAGVLAPQYNRAIGALLWDIGQGNLRGQLARRALAKGTAAIMAMTVAVSYALGESEEEIADHLNPLSHNFMTWEIAGQRVGPGSKMRSLLYLAGKITKSPEDAAYHAGRFLRGNFAPFIGTSMDLITGRNYMGDPTREGLPSLSRTILGENLLPIWVQSVAFEGGDIAGKVTRGLVEFAGMRGYPRGAYGDLRARQDELAQARFGMSWEELGVHPNYGKLTQMRLIRENPELEELSEKAEEDFEKWARGEQLIWNEYNAELEHLTQLVNNEINAASRQFEQTGDGSKFRERINQAFWLKGEMRGDLLERDEFSLVREYYSKPPDADVIAKMSPQDAIYREYNQTMYSADMYDQYGEYRWDEADRRRQAFIQKYGTDAMDYVEEIIGERRADEPTAVKMLRQARVVLQPYWDTERQVWSQLPQGLKQVSDQIKILERTDPIQAKRELFNYPQIVFARRQIALLKRQLKLRSPEIANALNMFYRY
ncbi:MAG: hypothetical protein E3J66_02125 [Dehalococcoidia bacterium]|nr:MAG: hypothetical protein E3J66_02125 [Dehalococcoidia bacterium]